MALTYQTLLEVIPERLNFGFSLVEPNIATASASFDTHVRSVVDSGVAWQGEGQPAASRVMRTNALALETARLQMRAGAKAMSALATAITKAQKELETLLGALKEIESSSDGYSFKISADGEVTLDFHLPPGSNQVDASLGPMEAAASQATAQIKSIVGYANSADITAKALLDRILGARPVFSANASGIAITYNAFTWGHARHNLGLAELSGKAWTAKDPLEWNPYVPADFDWKAGLAAALGIEDVDSFVKGRATDTGLELAEHIAPHTLKKGVPIVGWALTWNDFTEGGRVPPHSAHDDDPHNPVFDGGSHTALNTRLQSIVDRYEGDGEWNLAQLARLQGSGALPPDGEDYVHQAREVRRELREWLRDPDDGPTSGVTVVTDPDRDLARRLADDLDKALGGAD